MVNFSAENTIGDFIDRNFDDFDHFAQIELLIPSFFNRTDDKRVAAIVLNGGIRKGPAKLFAAKISNRFISGFFGHFANSCCLRIWISGIHDATWNLQSMFADPDAILFHEDDLSVLSDGDDVAPVFGPKKVELMSAFILTGFAMTLHDTHNRRVNNGALAFADPAVFLVIFRSFVAHKRLSREVSLSLFFAPAFFYTGAIMMTERRLSRKPCVSGILSGILMLAFVFATAFQGSSEAYAFSSKKMDSSSLIWVARKDGATSCGTVPGQSLEEGAAELQKQGVKVLGSRKGNDGKMHALSCGMPTGSMNVYQIERQDVTKALSLGFQEEAKH